jgi:hypothetical protein
MDVAFRRISKRITASTGGPTSRIVASFMHMERTISTG